MLCLIQVTVRPTLAMHREDSSAGQCVLLCMSTVQGGHFFTPKERTPIQLCVLMLQLLPQPRVEGERWKVFLCLPLFVSSTVIIGLNLTNSCLLPFNKAQDLDTKLQKPFTPLSPHTESPLATQRSLVPPDLSISTWLVTPNPSQTAFSERHSLPSPDAHVLLYPLGSTKLV